LAVPAFSRGQGLSTSSVNSVLARRDGTVLFAASNGLYQWSQGQITTYDSTQDQSRAPLSIYEDKNGRTWAVTRSEFGYLENRKFVSLSGIPGGVVRSIVEGSSGDLWILNQEIGLIQLRGTSIVQQVPWAKLGHQDFAASLAFDPVQGGLWIGFFQGGLVYFRDGKVEASFGVADGLGEGRVTDLRLDPEGTLWAATAGGLSRLKNNRIVTLTSANGLPCNTIHWLTQDSEHFVWLNTTCGLVRIAHGELVAWANSRDQNRDLHEMISATVFDSSDGVRSYAYLSGLYPQVGKSPDGRLWFTALDSVSVVDPRHLPFNKLPPPVHIEEITADRKLYEVTAENNGSLRLPALSRDLQIDYTALSLIAPGKIRFRYKLEGYDKDWQDAGNRRQAFYTNLPPRNYRFRVIACNNSGVWNETGAFIDFTIASAYYQTVWFRVLLGIVFLFVLFALYRLRVRQVAQQVRAGMEGRLDERERIARDLHDTLLQSVQGLILKFHAGIKQIPLEIPARQTMERALDHADQVLAEGRDRVRNLRATAVSIDDLPVAFKSVAEETPQGRSATFKTVVEGSVRQLHPLVHEESYCIGREAIVNALTHSGGRNVEVEIIYENRQFRLRVRDDGHGIDPKVLAEGGRSDHWGMQGMRERANRIGAELKIWSGHGTGTEVELTVPGATAYQADGANATRLGRRFTRSRSNDVAT
jgi:signal transduction histidine kinase